MKTYIVVSNLGVVREVPETDMPEVLKKHRNRTTDPSEAIKFIYPKGQADLDRAEMLRLGRHHNMPLPDILRIEATNHCNAHCTFCPREGEMMRPMGIMKMDLFKKLVQECREIGIDNISMQHHGESLLDKKLPEKVKYAKDMGIKSVDLITNGELLTETKAIALIQAGLDGISISLDAGGKEAYETTRVGLKYDTVSANLLRLIALRDWLGKLTPRVVCSFVYRDNMGEYTAFADNWKHKVDAMRATPLHNWTDRLSTRGRVTVACSRLWQTMTVLWDGRIALCCLDYDAAVVLGDANQTSLKDIWYSEPYVAAREAHLLGTGPHPCITCDLPASERPDWVKAAKLID